jgi:MerR family transcriptional regulator, light-induced transcriptional regulator
MAPVGTMPETALADYMSALAAGDARRALGLIDALIDAGVEFDDLCEEVIRPAMYEIGVMWEEGRLGVADEHLAASISETVLALIGAITSAPPDAQPRVLVCATDGETHSIGARMVAETFAAVDWSVQFLGASTPPDEVARAVAERNIDVLALSTTMPSNLPAAAETVELVREAAPSARIVVGGQAYGGDAARARKVGADYFQSGLRGLAERVEEFLAA